MKTNTATMLLAGATAMALGLAGAGLAHAQAYGTDGSALTIQFDVDSNGTHPAGNNNCDFVPSGGTPWCGGGHRTSTTGAMTSVLDMEQGSISGSVNAQNSTTSRVFGGATIDGSWWDTFTLGGPDLTPDSVVDIQVTVDLQVTDFEAALAAPPPYTRMQASINYGGPDGTGLAGVTLYDTGATSSVGVLHVSPSGGPFQLWGRFFSTTNVNDSPPDLGNVVGVADYHLDVVGIEASPSLHAPGQVPGVQLITASGHDYSSLPPSAVPEPATWAMLLVGLGLAGAGRRRRTPGLATVPA
jgi:hypothetical protein